MNKRRKRTLQDICDATQPQVTFENFQSLNSRSKSQKADYRGKPGTFNVCSAPSSSCFHVNKVVMKSNDESAGRRLSLLSTVAGMNSTSDSFSGDSVGKSRKTSSRTSNASASDDDVVHSKSKVRRVLEGHDDCLSCVSVTDEHANKKRDTKDGAINYGKPSKVQNTISEAFNGGYVSEYQNPMDVKDEKTSATKNEMKNEMSPPRGVASDVCGDQPATDLNSTQMNDVMEVEYQPIDITDDSDMMEQDVKVCDICGDAGREDLLAICSWCSDGAEHTYCMREMRSEVPEGEWLCEECQSLERAGNRTEEKIGKIDENEKKNSGHTSSEYVNSSDVEGLRTKGYMKISGKRHIDDDDAEVSSLVKKPNLESKLQSPRPSNSGKAAALTRENSVKKLDKGRSDIAPVNDTTESASSVSDLRVHSFQGTFSKSSSFSVLNSKPKVKLVDQVVLSRQKSANEPSSLCRKDGFSRSIGKSMSFKSSNSGRYESKVTISPRVSHVHDLKNTKQRSPFERQHSFRTERSPINSAIDTSVSSTSKIDKRPTSRGESSFLAATANHHEMKTVLSDSKSASLSRSSSLVARKNADISSSSGEFKRPSIHDSSCSDVSERPILNADEGVPDGLHRNSDLTNSGQRMKECSGSRSGLPPAKCLRDDGNNLRAAIEAAMLKKPGVYRKHRALGQSVDSSGSSLGCDAPSHQQPISNYARNKKMSSDAQLPETERPTMFSLSTDPSTTAEVPFFLKSVAVPEHEYIWQGSFEICRRGRSFDSWDGIQAHLSTGASPKVTDAVNKFESRVLLYEVPRLSTWPLHFQELGVREDNIAVFFFAKDLESYNKIYKVLLDNMIKNDLALKGNVNGIELLIFPSSQLPVNSQRWNMLFFLWGVFRGKKESCMQQMPESSNQLCTTGNIPPPLMSFPENRCSLGPIAEDLHGNEDPASEELLRLLSSRVANTIESFDHRPNPSSVQCDIAYRCQETRGASQEEDMSTPLGIGSLVMHFDTPVDEGIMSDKTCKQNQMKTSRPPEDGETLVKDQAGPTRDLNNNTWLINHKKIRNECNESAAAERRFFPTESQFPWKMHSQLEQDDRAPDLELALGAAERKSLLDLTVGSNGVNSIHDEEGGGTHADDRVAEASLSLSLSFPFPPDTAKPAEQNQLVTRR